MEQVFDIKLTERQIEYIQNLLQMSKDSLIDLKDWEEQEIMTDDEISEEESLIYSIISALNSANM